MNLKQIFAKLDSLEEAHGYGRFRVNLDGSVEVYKGVPVVEWWDYGSRIDSAEGLNEDQEEEGEDEDQEEKSDKSHGLVYPRSLTTGYSDEP